MRRILRNLDIIAGLLVLALVFSLAACDKEKPTPVPEPTPVVVTEVPTSSATCFAGTHPGTGQPICQDGDGNIVTCPSDISKLPACS